MLAKPIIEEFSLLCDRVGYDLIRGSFSAWTNEDMDGQIELIVAPQGKYLIFYWDTESNKLSGRYNDGNGDVGIGMGDAIPEEEKAAFLTGIAARIQS